MSRGQREPLSDIKEAIAAIHEHLARVDAMHPISPASAI